MSRSRVRVRERLRAPVVTTDPAALAAYASELRPMVAKIRTLAEDATARPLRPGASVARELPNGRGFLRVVQGGKSAPTAPAIEAPPSPPVASVGPSVAAPADDDPQLDLLAWRPRPAKPIPPPGTQLSLFGDHEGQD